jgi:hypothetical protein
VKPDPASASPPSVPQQRSGIGRRHGIAILVLIGLFLAAVVALSFGFDADWAFATLRDHHQHLAGYVAGAPVAASLLFMAVYALAVAVSVPGLAVLTVAGG